MSRHTTTRLPFVTLNGRGVHESRIDRRHALNHRRIEGLLHTACAPVKSKTLSAAGQAPRPGHQRVVVGIRNRNTDYKLVPSNRPSKQCKRVLGGLEQTLATLKVKASSGASVKIG